MKTILVWYLDIFFRYVQSIHMMILMTQLQDNHTDSQPVKLLYVCHIVIKRRQQLHQALYHIYRVSLENGILWEKEVYDTAI